MNKFTKTTLGRKLLAFYLVFFAISFFCLYSLGYSYLRNRVYYETESELRSLGITLMSAHLNEDALSKKKINSLYPQLRTARSWSCWTVWKSWPECTRPSTSPVAIILHGSTRPTPSCGM